MFSRSDNAGEPAGAPNSGPLDEGKSRSPVLLAVLAGLLAVAGTFLLARSLTSTEPVAGEAQVAVEETQQVLVVTQPIPAGTEVTEILESPAAWLSARAVPEQFVAESAISSVEELRELEGLTLASDALAGEQLLRERFIDRNDFQNESFIDRVAAVAAPAGHYTMVVNLDAANALGGNVRPGDEVTVTSTFRVDPPEREPFELALVVLPTVEVVNVETSAEVIGEVSSNVDVLGRATIGSFAITLAVEPGELTDLVYAMKYGDIVLAEALQEGTDRDERELSTIDTILSGGDFFADNSGIDFVLGNLVDPQELSEFLVGVGGAVDERVLGEGDDSDEDAGPGSGEDGPEASPASVTSEPTDDEEGDG